jgi:hypothetical protein
MHTQRHTFKNYWIDNRIISARNFILRFGSRASKTTLNLHWNCITSTAPFLSVFSIYFLFKFSLHECIIFECWNIRFIFLVIWDWTKKKILYGNELPVTISVNTQIAFEPTVCIKAAFFCCFFIYLFYLKEKLNIFW